ncbi:MAG: hypothetical protein ABSE63_04220 [Thermoguttaceae bacterium]|jgi:hypothetical protein
MAEPESSHIDTNLRLETFRFIEKNKHGLETTQLTLFKLLQLVVSLTCGLVAAAILVRAIRDGLVGWGIWRGVLATLGGIAVGVVGFIVGFVPFDLLERLLTRRLFRKVQKSSNEDLWRIVDLGLWNFRYTLALLQLGARGQDICRELPTVIKLLASNNPLFRGYAWDALRLVFFDEAHAITDYNPKASTDDCCAKVARLLREISPDEKEALLSSCQEHKRISTWKLIVRTDAAQFSCDKILTYVFQRMHNTNASPSDHANPATAQEETPKG